ncbi:MAG: glycosyltransferase family 2 protein [Acidobacteriales bacterium]|nr:glycosyltransferase family 2 protein [Terriglobales bacterium]
MTLSVAIVAHNEEANIGRTLASVQWADEIILVDAQSTDQTRDIAAAAGAKVILEPWRGYVAQKNYALELCTQEWILSLDADEVVPPELADEIRRIISSNAQHQGYSMPRKNLFLGRWMQHGGFYPDRKLRLFRRGQGSSTGFDPHDHFELKDHQPEGRLQHALIHHTYPTLTLYIEHMNRYSSLGAAHARSKGQKGSLGNILLRPAATFLYNYFFRSGFLDGREGLLLHLYHAGYVSWKYAKLWEQKCAGKAIGI